MSRREGNIAVIDIDSSRIKVVVANAGVNNSFVIKSSNEMKYDGFQEGRFLDEEALPGIIRQLVGSTIKHTRPKITQVYVNVPGDFTTVHVSNEKIEFEDLKEITPNDVQIIFERANKISTDKYTIINRSPVYYLVDGEKRVIKAIGESTRTLEACVSFVLAENYFINVIDKILASVGLQAEYVSAAYSTAMYVFEPEIRDRYALLAQIGYISSSVMLIRGDGLLFLKSFDCGDGNIAADICEVLDTPFEVAEELKNKVNLSLTLDNDAEYTAKMDGKVVGYQATLVHDVVEQRIVIISNLIRDCLAQCRFPYPDYLPITITGGSICNIKGAKEIISKELGKSVVLADPKVAYPVSHGDTAIYGLLSLAIQHEVSKPQKKSLFRRR